MFSKNKKYSFTLVELMIVLAILALLAGIVIFVVKPGNILDEFNDQKRLSEIKSIAKAIDYLNTISLGNLNLGTSTSVYLSLPDNTSTTCSSYALPTLPTGFSYQCKNTTDYRKNDSTGWIPINFRESDNSNLLSTLPIDPTNDIYYYYSYNPGGSYEINAFFKTTKYINTYGSLDGGDSMNAIELGTNLFDMPTTFPHNWIKVPGNPLYSTSDFWVMQYEAKYSITGHGASDATTDCKADSSYDTFDYGKAGACATYIPTWNNANTISSPLGSPLAGVSHNEAKAICVSLGGHVITNQEWMTIARNADQQASNWTSGTKGTGYLFNGNSNNTTRGYNGSDPDKGINRNVRAALILSNGSKIYDFSGNVWEHTLVDINDTLLDALPNDGGAEGWRYVELTALTTYGDFASYDMLKPTDPFWDSDQGIGQIYTNSAVQSDRVLLCGGDWADNFYAGAFALRLNWSVGGVFYSIGFRCVKN